MADKSKQLFDKLIEYSEADYYPFHMPGHKRNMKWDTNIYDMDITEIDGFDNLHHPEGIIKELEDRITTLYNAKKSFVMVNGSTGGLLSGIYSTVNYGDKILIARNCHKSVYNAVLLNGLNVRFVYPELDDNNICGPIGPDKVEEALKKDDSIKLVVITSPTYEGVVSDIEEIAKIVHKYKKILIESFNIPDKCPQTKQRGSLVLGFQVREDFVHFLVLDHHQHGVVHLRPGVVAQVGCSVETALAFDILPAGVSPLAVFLQDFHYLFVICLIVGYENRFHLYASFLKSFFFAALFS